MYCCYGLQNDIANAGQRGLSILVFKVPDKDDIWFVLQSRGVAFDDEGKLGPIPAELTPIPYRINISTCGVIKYCPTCGRRLQDLAGASRDAFIALAEEHRKYLPKDFYQM
jgi:hypothetical protein